MCVTTLRGRVSVGEVASPCPSLSRLRTGGVWGRNTGFIQIDLVVLDELDHDVARSIFVAIKYGSASTTLVDAGCTDVVKLST